MPDPTDAKMNAALQKRQEMQETLVHHDAKIIDMLAAKELPKDKEFTKLAGQITTLAAKIHRHRMNIGRKRFSLRCRRKQIERIEEDVQQCLVVDQEMNAKLQLLQGEQEKIKERVTKQLQTKLKQQGLP